MTSRAAAPGQLRLEQAPDLLAGDATPAQALDGRGDERLPGAQPVGGPPGGGAGRDEGPGAVAQLEHALVLELPVDLRHRVRVDHQLLRERADAGELLAGTQRPGLDGVL